MTITRLFPLSATCPQCGSRDITYSCEPNCCFNHVCGQCYTTFELITATVGERIERPDLEPPERDSCDPAVACAHCDGIEVYPFEQTHLPDPLLVCLSCNMLLKLGYSDIDART